MPSFHRPLPPWRMSMATNLAPSMRLYQKQLQCTPEWETVASPHPYLRFASPDQKGLPLRQAAQLSGQWPAWYQHETLRQTGVTPLYKESAPPDPTWRDPYTEWLERDTAHDMPGQFTGEGARTREMRKRWERMAERESERLTRDQNLDGRAQVDYEIRQERFESYMRMRAFRNKKLGIDQYGVFNKKAVAYLKKIGEY
eukprot:TRINITY_DN35802_c0_g1_i1.p1 TRINITY_DN35802_c0_g1~~TRINITY_DN35802_c0_g1_i1.p1  ORF type:complete len:222 (+),score=75.70 TRINITY_DN35802_c0_g1_i1:72-668(+)